MKSNAWPISAQPTQAQRRRRAELVDALDALDRADAMAAVQPQLQAAGPEDCETCGESIPPDERASAPHKLRCAACQAALRVELDSYRSPLCQMRPDR